MTTWEELPDEIRGDVRRAAMTNLVSKITGVEDLLERAPLPDHAHLIARRQRLQRALDAASRLP